MPPKVYRKTFKRRTVKVSKKPMTRMIIADHKKLLAIGKPEQKHFDVSLQQNPGQNGQLSLLSGITQGTGDTQRVGIKAKFAKVYIRYILYNSNIATNSQEFIRVIIFIDKMGYNAPLVTDVLEPGQISTVFAPIANYNRNYQDRFRILYSKVHKLDALSNNSTTDYKTIKLNVQSDYIGAGTTFKNQLYILHCSTNNNVLAVSTLNFTSRLIYTDD